jgi:MoaA/NifB/PqqE/SkfB family radical SAM enzyme
MIRKRLGQIRYIKRPSQIIRLLTTKVKSLEIAITTKCNQHCQFCYARNFKTNKMTVQRYKYILYDLKPFHVNIQGGEPLLCPEVLEYIKATPKEIVLSLVTNGSLLTMDMADNLKAAGLNTIQISWGSWHKSDPTIAKYCKFIGLNVCLSVVNSKEQRRWVNAAVECAKLNGFHVLFNVPSCGWDKTFDDATYFRLRDHPVVREDNFFWAGKNKCPAGVEKAYISADLKFHPCDRLHQPFDSFKALKKHYLKYYKTHKRPFCLLMKEVEV